MRCCQEDCPNYSSQTEETELCAVCEKEFSLIHLADTAHDVSRVLESVDWRQCLQSLQQLDPDNEEVHKVQRLFEQLEQASDHLNARFVLETV